LAVKEDRLRTSAPSNDGNVKNQVKFSVLQQCFAFAKPQSTCFRLEEAP